MGAVQLAEGCSFTLLTWEAQTIQQLLNARAVECSWLLLVRQTWELLFELKNVVVNRGHQSSRRSILL